MAFWVDKSDLSHCGSAVPHSPLHTPQVLEQPENADINTKLKRLVEKLTKKGKTVTLLSSLASLMSIDGAHSHHKV